MGCPGGSNSFAAMIILNRQQVITLCLACQQLACGWGYPNMATYFCFREQLIHGCSCCEPLVHWYLALPLAILLALQLLGAALLVHVNRFYHNPRSTIWFAAWVAVLYFPRMELAEVWDR